MLRRAMPPCALSCSKYSLAPSWKGWPICAAGPVIGQDWPSTMVPPASWARTAPVQVAAAAVLAAMNCLRLNAVLGRSMNLPALLANWAENGRAKASVPPPAGNGTTRYTGLDGQSAAARAAMGRASAAIEAPAARNTARRPVGWEACMTCLLVASLRLSSLSGAAVPVQEKGHGLRRAPFHLHRASMSEDTGMRPCASRPR